MRIKKYRIRNYKAIADVEIKLNYSINPIIGVNESGKTTVLHAILAFDKNRDKVNSGRHLEYQNKYSSKDTLGCKISAYIKLDKDEVTELLEYVKVKTGSTDHKTLDDLYNNPDIILSRELSHNNMPHCVDELNLTARVSHLVTKFLLERLPFILYFDDFTDRVPDEIMFKEDYATSGKLVHSKNREWQEIIIEIFKRADVEGIDDPVDPLKKFFKLTNQDKRDNILSDIEDVLNDEIIKEWKRIKQSGKGNFADDSENLSIELKCDGQTFMFKVKDKSNNDKKRTFDICDRSKGFQWFFNYMVKLKFNPRYKGRLENSIFLLDEPGSYLHSTAQSELLQELKSVSKKNTIIYCTHSQYLLNPKTIKLGSIKIAEKHNASISIEEFGNYRGKDDKGALSAVYQALQLNFARDFAGKIIITEGITDMFFFEMLSNHCENVSTGFNIVPGVGAGNSSNLISIGLAFSDGFILFLDNDTAGKEAATKYVKQFGEHIQRHIHFYSNDNGFELEDFLSKNDIKRLAEITSTKDVKKALALLYYDYSDKQFSFFSELDRETFANLDSTINRINNLVEMDSLVGE